jgi:1,2-diacylglycerol 3-beta-galactosyltransferase
VDPRIDLIYVEAGGGHKAAASALESVLREQGRPWRLRLVNLNHVLSPADLIKKVTGYSLEDLYNIMLKNGWTLGTEQLMKPMHGLIWLYHSRLVSLLERFWQSDTPDMVVSLIPHFNRVMHEALGKTNPRAPFVTIITDFADIPPRVWLERQRQYVVCGTDKAVKQAYSFDHPPERVFRVSGMILRPSFYRVTPVDRAAERARLGLAPEAATGLVLFGGEGARAMVDIARRLDEAGLPLQLILMHGRNQELGRRLAALPLRLRRHIQGFTSDVAYFMQLADFMIGKPGPGSISEALAMKLPVIVDCNAWTMPQERYNAQWLEENELGLVVKSWREIARAVERLLAPGTLEAYRERAARLNNRAVFEIADILEEVLRRGP